MAKTPVDRYVSLLLIVICIGLYYYATTLSPHISTGSSELIGPAFLPKVMAVIIGVLSIIYFISSCGFRNKTESELKQGQVVLSSKGNKSKLWAKILGTVCIMVLYIIAISLIGYVISTAIYLFGFMLFLSPQKSCIKILLISVLTTGAIYLIFEKALLIVLPKGTLF